MNVRKVSIQCSCRHNRAACAGFGLNDRGGAKAGARIKGRAEIVSVPRNILL